MHQSGKKDYDLEQSGSGRKWAAFEFWMCFKGRAKQDLLTNCMLDMRERSQKWLWGFWAEYSEERSCYYAEM